MSVLQLLAFSILANSESSGASEFSGLVIFLMTVFATVFFGALVTVYVSDTEERK